MIFDESSCVPHKVQPGRYVKITVADSGVGIDKADSARASSSRSSPPKARGRGTGLGLASAYGIVKGHGGIINVYSEKGHGTTFTIYLPVSAQRDVEAEVRHAARHGA